MAVGPVLIRILRLVRTLKKLDQAVHQATAATDHVQPALVLMFFEDFVEVFFELRHGNLLWGIHTSTWQASRRIQALELFSG